MKVSLFFIFFRNSDRTVFIPFFEHADKDMGVSIKMTERLNSDNQPVGVIVALKNSIISKKGLARIAVKLSV